MQCSRACGVMCHMTLCPASVGGSHLLNKNTVLSITLLQLVQVRFQASQISTLQSLAIAFYESYI